MDEEQILAQLDGETDPDAIENLLSQLEKIGENDGDHNTGTSPGTDEINVELEAAKTEVPDTNATQSVAPTSKEGEQQNQGDEGEGNNYQPKITDEELRLAQQMEVMEQRLQLYTKQMTDQGITPAQLPTEIRVSQEALDALREDMDELGPVGQVAHDMAYQLKNLESKIQMMVDAQQGNASASQSTEPKHQAPEDVNKIIAQTPGLPEIMADPTKRALAVQLDEKLKLDAKYKDKPIAERFKAVVQQLGEQFKPPQNPKDPTITGELAPYSIESSGGQSNSADVSALQRFEDMDGGDAQAYASQMSDAQLDALFDEFLN